MSLPVSRKKKNKNFSNFRWFAFRSVTREPTRRLHVPLPTLTCASSAAPVESAPDMPTLLKILYALAQQANVLPTCNCVCVCLDCVHTRERCFEFSKKSENDSWNNTWRFFTSLICIFTFSLFRQRHWKSLKSKERDFKCFAQGLLWLKVKRKVLFTLHKPTTMKSNWPIVLTRTQLELFQHSDVGNSFCSCLLLVVWNFW